MSIKLLNRCWLYSQNKGGNLLVLLAIADFSNDEGLAFPSISTLARKARLTHRNTQRAVRRLAACGELDVEESSGPHGTHLYRIVLPEGTGAEGRQSMRVTKCQRDNRDNKGVTFQPYKPSEETVIHKETPGDDKKSPAATLSISPDRPLSEPSTGNGREEIARAPTIECEFDEFWGIYPARNGKRVGKATAWKKFQLLTPENRKLILVAAVNYAASELGRKGFVKIRTGGYRTAKVTNPGESGSNPNNKQTARR